MRNALSIKPVESKADVARHSAGDHKAASTFDRMFDETADEVKDSETEEVQEEDEEVSRASRPRNKLLASMMKRHADLLQARKLFPNLSDAARMKMMARRSRASSTTSTVTDDEAADVMAVIMGSNKKSKIKTVVKPAKTKTRMLSTSVYSNEAVAATVVKDTATLNLLAESGLADEDEMAQVRKNKQAEEDKAAAKRKVNQDKLKNQAFVLDAMQNLSEDLRSREAAEAQNSIQTKSFVETAAEALEEARAVPMDNEAATAHVAAAAKRSSSAVSKTEAKTVAKAEESKMEPNTQPTMEPATVLIEETSGQEPNELQRAARLRAAGRTQEAFEVEASYYKRATQVLQGGAR